MLGKRFCLLQPFPTTGCGDFFKDQHPKFNEFSISTDRVVVFLDGVGKKGRGTPKMAAAAAHTESPRMLPTSGSSIRGLGILRNYGDVSINA